MSGALSAAARRHLLETARAAIERWLLGCGLLEAESADPELMQIRGAFVSLKRRPGGELRGCVGRTKTGEPLLRLVAQAAVAAACDDPRFDPLTADELPSVAVQISVLGPLRPVTPEEVEVGTHGLLVRHLGHTGVLLPEVARERGWDREVFLSWACRKAGLPGDAWRHPECRLEAFTATVFAEGEDGAAAGAQPPEPRPDESGRR